MPGPTQTSNPWAEELKRSRRKSSRSSIKGKPGNEGCCATVQSKTDDGQSETMAIDVVAKEKAASSEVSDECVKANIMTDTEVARSPPPKVRPPSLPIEDSRSLYQDARSALRPVARMLSRSLSKEAKIEDVETPVDRLIRQGSIEPVKPAKG